MIAHVDAHTNKPNHEAQYNEVVDRFSKIDQIATIKLKKKNCNNW